jgi:hypothetical protein
VATIPELQAVPALRDHWVAIDTTGRIRSDQTPLRVRLQNGAVVVDADAELDVLCRRLSEERRTSLTILFAG